MGDFSTARAVRTQTDPEFEYLVARSRELEMAIRDAKNHVATWRPSC